MPTRVHGFTASQIDGRRHEMGLGAFPSVSLSEARGRALGLRTVVRLDRVDPLRVRREAEAAKAHESAGAQRQGIQLHGCRSGVIAAHSRLHPTSKRVLNIELLAYNVNDSINLKPLSLDLARQIHASTDKHAPEYK